MNKQIKKLYPAIVFTALLCSVFVQAGLSIAQENKLKSESESETVQPADEQTIKEKVEKEPAPFVASEEVSANQAVAFPTDI